MNTKKIIVNASNLSKTYKSTKAVKNIDFIVYENECFGLLGPNGAGKTTAMKMIYCLSPKTDGELSVFGLNPDSEKHIIKYHIGVVPQEDSLDEELSVIDNLYIFAGFFGISKKKAKNRIEELIEFMDLSNKAKSKIRELSGGMKRRLVICRALINNPKLLILDEPTTGLDPQIRHQIWAKLRELKTKGITMLLTTHYMEEATQMCDRIIIMNEGEIIKEGNPKELIKDNVKKYVLEFTNEIIDVKKFYTNYKNIDFDSFGDRSYLLSEIEAPLIEILEKLPVSDKLIRNATLEDLFLKLTGKHHN